MIRRATSEKKKRKRPGAPRKLRFTREGRVFVLVTLGVGAGAVNTGNNLLYLVLGLMLSLIVLSGILSELVLRDVRVKRSLPRRAFAGTPCLVELEVENRKTRAPSYSIELEDVFESAAGRAEGRCYFLKIPPRDRACAAYRFVPNRRGRVALAGVIVRTRYPFGLFEKWRVLPLEEELLVYPELGPDAPPPAGQGLSGHEVPTEHPGQGTEVAGLRAYREGDEARSIHWRRTASLGRVVVRERERDTARRMTVVIDDARPAAADEAWDARLELAISRAARTAARALSAGSAVEAVTRSASSPLVLPGRPPDPVWRFLALIEAQPRSVEAEAEAETETEAEADAATGAA